MSSNRAWTVRPARKSSSNLSSCSSEGSSGDTLRIRVSGGLCVAGSTFGGYQRGHALGAFAIGLEKDSGEWSIRRLGL